MNKDDLNRYQKYYQLETYLFDEVSKNFHMNHCLSPKEFYAIVIWKSNRVKQIVKDGIKKSGKTIDSLTREISQENSDKRKMEILENIDGIGIPIASAILAVCYPKKFTIVDYRVREALKTFNIHFEGNPTNSIKVYFEYLHQCQQLAEKFNLSFRELDKRLWGKDFYEGKGGLLQFTKGLR